MILHAPHHSCPSLPIPTPQQRRHGPVTDSLADSPLHASFTGHNIKSMAANDININTAILIERVKLHHGMSTRTKYRMKWACVLPLLFIFYTNIIIWGLAKSHPHDHEDAVYGDSLDRGGVMQDNFDISSEASSSRRIIEDQNSENEDGSLNGDDYVKGDYGISDPPPVTSWPAKKPVQYRIFSRPPSPSPHP